MRIDQLVELPNLPIKLGDIQRTGKTRVQFQLNRVRTRQGFERIDDLVSAQEDFKPVCLLRAQGHAGQ